MGREESGDGSDQDESESVGSDGQTATGDDSEPEAPAEESDRTESASPGRETESGSGGHESTPAARDRDSEDRTGDSNRQPPNGDRTDATDHGDRPDSIDMGDRPDPTDQSDQRPPSHHEPSEPDPRDGVRSALAWFRQTDDGWVSLARETLVSLLVVLAIGLILFAISGVWPPLVAVESDSMDPHLQKGDLVLVMEEDRFAPPAAAGDTGIVTVERGRESGYERFGGYGDVIVFKPYGSDSATPIIHRAHLYVEEGENWYDRADQSITNADSCEDLGGCPASTDGFVTSGDNTVSNDYYDQERGISSVVEPDWVRGRAVVRIPWVGWIRLAASDLDLPGLAVSTPVDADLMAQTGQTTAG